MKICFFAFSATFGNNVCYHLFTPGLKKTFVCSFYLNSLIYEMWTLAMCNLMPQTTKLSRITLRMEAMEEIGKMVEDGRLNPICGRVFPMEEAAKAFKLLAAGEQQEKIVIKVEEIGHFQQVS